MRHDNAVITLRDPLVLAFRRRSCERKRWFVNAKVAQKVGDRFGQRVYHCRFCSGYHLTSQGGDVEAELKALSDFWVAQSKPSGWGAKL